MGEVIYLKKEKIILPKKEYEEYHQLLEEAKITESLIRILIIRHKLKNIVKNAKKKELLSKKKPK